MLKNEPVMYTDIDNNGSSLLYCTRSLTVVLVSATDSDMPMSPFLGVVIGAIVTIIILILLIGVRIRSQAAARDRPTEQKIVSLNLAQGGQPNTVKTLNRSSSPREVDERDPDVIPAKYGNYSRNIYRLKVIIYH